MSKKLGKRDTNDKGSAPHPPAPLAKPQKPLELRSCPGEGDEKILNRLDLN